MSAIEITRRTEGRAEAIGLPVLLSLDQVATTLGTSKAWVRDHATRRNPRIPVVRLGGKRALLRFRPQDIQRFITDHLDEGGV